MMIWVSTTNIVHLLDGWFYTISTLWLFNTKVAPPPSNYIVSINYSYLTIIIWKQLQLQETILRRTSNLHNYIVSCNLQINNNNLPTIISSINYFHLKLISKLVYSLEYLIQIILCSYKVSINFLSNDLQTIIYHNYSHLILIYKASIWLSTHLYLIEMICTRF